MSKRILEAGKLFPAVLAVLLILAMIPARGGESDKEVVGWIQDVRLYPGAMLLKAKMDTGAKTSSLNARHIERFIRDGEDWVRFSVTDTAGRTVTFERPELRTVRIKRQFGRVQTRPVVALGLCLGPVLGRTQVNLADREGFNYQLLVGRRFLEGKFLVDPSQTFVKPPRCSPRQ